MNNKVRGFLDAGEHAPEAWRKALCEDMPPSEYLTEADFYISPLIRGNLYMLSLFTRISEQEFVYSPLVNYHKARTDFLLDSDTFPTSLVDVALSEDEPNIFCNSPMEVLFYTEKQLFNIPEDDLDPCRLTSMSYEAIKKKHYNINQVLLQKTTVPVFPTQDDFLKVCYILDV